MFAVVAEENATWLTCDVAASGRAIVPMHRTGSLHHEQHEH